MILVYFMTIIEPTFRASPAIGYQVAACDILITKSNKRVSELRKQKYSLLMLRLDLESGRIKS